MRALVTGATGRVGANMVKRLITTGAEVRAMVMPNDPQVRKLTSMAGVEIVEADLSDQAAVDHACREVTHVIHLAAQLVRGDTPVDRFYDINTMGTLRLLEGVVRAGGVERFVLASTDGTYRPGDPPSVPLTEETSQVPADYYGTSKLLGEVVLRNHAAQFGIDYAIVRFATVVDPAEARQRFRVGSLRSLLGRAGMGRDTNIWQLFAERPPLIDIFERAVRDAPESTAAALVGPGGEPWSTHLLDVRDATQGLHLALTSAAASGREFNIAGPSPTPHDVGAAVVAELDGVDRIVVEMPLTWRLELSIDRAREVLGYRPAYDFRSTVEDARATQLDDLHDYVPARV